MIPTETNFACAIKISEKHSKIRNLDVKNLLVYKNYVSPAKKHLKRTEETSKTHFKIKDLYVNNYC